MIYISNHLSQCTLYCSRPYKTQKRKRKIFGTLILVVKPMDLADKTVSMLISDSHNTSLNIKHAPFQSINCRMGYFDLKLRYDY